MEQHEESLVRPQEKSERLTSQKTTALRSPDKCWRRRKECRPARPERWRQRARCGLVERWSLALVWTEMMEKKEVMNQSKKKRATTTATTTTRRKHIRQFIRETYAVSWFVCVEVYVSLGFLLFAFCVMSIYIILCRLCILLYFCTPSELPLLLLLLRTSPSSRHRCRRRPTPHLALFTCSSSSSSSRCSRSCFPTALLRDEPRQEAKPLLARRNRSQHFPPLLRTTKRRGGGQRGKRRRRRRCTGRRVWDQRLLLPRHHL